MSAAPAGTTRQTCPLADEVRLVEIKEVVVFGTARTRRNAAGRNQYINLDDRVDTTAAHPEYGRLIRLQARVEWVAGDRTRSLAGKTVYWYRDAASGNKTGLTGNDSEAFNAVGSGLTRISTATDAQGWTSEVSFYLSVYGGDSFSAYATMNAGYTGGMQAGPYVVWKKFWFQVVEMNDSAGGVFNLPASVISDFQAGYRTVFIEWEEQTPRANAAYAANLADGTARASAARPHFRNDNLVPFKALIMTCDYSQTGNQQATLTARLTSGVWDSGTMIPWRLSGPAGWLVSAEYQLVNPPRWTCGRVTPACGGHAAAGHRCPSPAGSVWNCGAASCPTHRAATDVCPSGTFHCSRTTPACGGHAARSDVCPSPAGAVWSCRARNCPGHASSGDVCPNPPAWRAIPAANVSLAGSYTPLGFKHVHVDLSSGPVTPSAANPVNIRIVVLQAGPNFSLGWGGGSSALYLCTGTLRDIHLAADWNAFQRSDVVHELGHALGLVNMAPTAANAHDAWADTVSTPPQPSHCRKPPSQCAMWWQSSATRLTTFHLDGGVGCHDHLRRQDFSRSVLSGQWGPP